MKEYLWVFFLMIGIIHCTHKAEKKGSFEKIMERNSDTLCVQYNTLASTEYRLLESCGHFISGRLSDSINKRIANEDTTGINLAVYGSDQLPMKFIRKDTVLLLDVYILNTGDDYYTGKINRVANDSIFLGVQLSNRRKPVANEGMVFRISYGIICKGEHKNPHVFLGR